MVSYDRFVPQTAKKNYSYPFGSFDFNGQPAPPAARTIPTIHTPFKSIKMQTSDTEKRVILRQGYLLERFDGELTVYHPTLTTSLYLNETGALIWNLCDGNRSISEIIALLSSYYPENSAQIELDVIALIKRLVDQNIAELW